jgi:hypothetical protein
MPQLFGSPERDISLDKQRSIAKHGTSIALPLMGLTEGDPWPLVPFA